MANMSYCRFENTSMDMADCVDAMQDMELRDGVWGWYSYDEDDEDIRNGEWNPLSEYEQAGVKRLIDLAQGLLDMTDEH